MRWWSRAGLAQRATPVVQFYATALFSSAYWLLMYKQPYRSSQCPPGVLGPFLAPPAFPHAASRSLATLPALPPGQDVTAVAAVDFPHTHTHIHIHSCLPARNSFSPAPSHRRGRPFRRRPNGAKTALLVLGHAKIARPAYPVIMHHTRLAAPRLQSVNHLQYAFTLTLACRECPQSSPVAPLRHDAPAVDAALHACSSRGARHLQSPMPQRLHPAPASSPELTRDSLSFLIPDSTSA